MGSLRLSQSQGQVIEDRREPALASCVWSSPNLHRTIDDSLKLQPAKNGRCKRMWWKKFQVHLKNDTDKVLARNTRTPDLQELERRVPFWTPGTQVSFIPAVRSCWRALRRSSVCETQDFSPPSSALVFEMFSDCRSDEGHGQLFRAQWHYRPEGRRRSLQRS